MKPCPSCGHDLPEINRFCTQCGRALDGSPPQAALRPGTGKEKEQLNINILYGMVGLLLVALVFPPGRALPRSRPPFSVFGSSCLLHNRMPSSAACSSRSNSRRPPSPACICRFSFEPKHSPTQHFEPPPAAMLEERRLFCRPSCAHDEKVLKGVLQHRNVVEARGLA